MKNREYIMWIVKTALFTALLVTAQAATAPLGITLITGSLVNLILIASAMICGLPTGCSVAVISPFFAKIFGIGPLWVLIPFIAAGNLVIVALWHFIGNRNFANRYVAYIVALVAGAVCKFAVLYVSIVLVVIPFFLDLPEKQAAAISAAFSVQQLFTAAIGGALAIAIIPLVKRAVKQN